MAGLKTWRSSAALLSGTGSDGANPTFNKRSINLYLWIEPVDGSEPFCANVDRYRRWSPAEPTPIPRGRGAVNRMPVGKRGEDMLFTGDGDTERHHTRPPRNAPELGIISMGDTWEFLGNELVCKPDALPLAVWTDNDGFQPIGRDEEMLIASYSLNDERVVEDSEGFWESYDWESKDFWREQGWYFVLLAWNYEPSVNEHWQNEVRYAYPLGLRATCWGIPNKEDVPRERYCLECERREHMELYATDEE